MKLTGTIAITGAVICFLMAGCGPSTDTLNQQALTALEQGDYAQAATWLAEAIAQDRENPVLRGNLATVYIRQERWEEAAGILRKALEFDTGEETTRLQLMLAEVLIRSGQNVPAHTILAEMVGNDPATVTDEYLLFLHGYTATQPKHAIDSLKRALELNPERKETYLALARAYSWDGEAAAAEEVLSKMEEHFQNTTTAQLYRLAFLLRDMRTSTAAELVNQLDPEIASKPMGRLLQAYLSLLKDETTTAEDLFLELEAEPEVAHEARLGSAYCALLRNAPNEAIGLCEEVLSGQPDQTAAHNLMGLGQVLRLQLFLAKTSFNDSLELDPSQPAIEALVNRISHN